MRCYTIGIGMSTLNSRPSEKYAWAGELRTVDIRDSGADWLGVRPTMVMVSVVGRTPWLAPALP